MTLQNIEYINERELPCKADEADTLDEYVSRLVAAGELLDNHMASLRALYDDQTHIFGSKQEITAAFRGGRRITLESLTDDQRKRALTVEDGCQQNGCLHWIVRLEPREE